MKAEFRPHLIDFRNFECTVSRPAEELELAKTKLQEVFMKESLDSVDGVKEKLMTENLDTVEQMAAMADLIHKKLEPRFPLLHDLDTNVPLLLDLSAALSPVLVDFAWDVDNALAYVMSKLPTGEPVPGTLDELVKWIIANLGGPQSAYTHQRIMERLDGIQASLDTIQACVNVLIEKKAVVYEEVRIFRPKGGTSDSDV